MSFDTCEVWLTLPPSREAHKMLKEKEKKEEEKKKSPANWLRSSVRTLAQISILIGNPDGPNTITVTLPPGPGQPALQWRNTHYGPGMSFDILLNQNEFADIKQQDGSVPPWHNNDTMYRQQRYWLQSCWSTYCAMFYIRSVLLSSFVSSLCV